MSFAIISGEAGTRIYQTVDLATGPFETREEAEEFAALLAKTSKGRHTIIALHTPSPPVPDVCECGAATADACGEWGEKLPRMNTPELMEQADNGCGWAQKLATEKLSR